MDELKEKADYYECYLLRSFVVLLLCALILSFSGVNKLANIALWGALAVFIAQKCIRILDICYLMQSRHYFVRLFLAFVNYALLGMAMYILYDLLMLYGKEALFNFNLRKVLCDLLELLTTGVLFLSVAVINNEEVEFPLLTV